MSNPPGGSGLTVLGKLFSVLLVLGLVGLGAWIVLQRGMPQAPPNAAPRNGGGAGGGVAASKPGFDTKLLSETKMAVPTLPPLVAYVPAKPNVIDIELSEYAGYAGLIAVNGGLAPSADSPFTKKHGFMLNLTLSEEESWGKLNEGKMAASATTVDVLAAYGRQFQVVVPAQIGYSRGADGLVVRSDIKRVNQLKGKVVVSSQFTESDFFIRYLAKEAGIPVNMLADLDVAPDPQAINVVYCATGEDAGTLFETCLKAGSNALAGCVTWAPKTTEIPEQSGGKAALLVSNKNLLIIADILVVNRGFAEKNPDKVNAIVDGLLMGNRMVRDNPDANADVIGKAFKWSREQTATEMAKVHLSNLPENQAFFGGGITAGGSFASIYQSAVLAYGTDLLPNPVDSDYFLAPDALKQAAASGLYKDQVAAIVPLSSHAGGALEVDPILSKDIRFYFEPMSDKLDITNPENLSDLGAIKRMLDVSPGSHVLLVGHVDDSNIPKLFKQGGQPLVDKMALEAIDLSKRRATEIRNQLVNLQKVDATRIETVGRGWTQPVSKTNPELNRRVEVQWFTLE